MKKVVILLLVFLVVSCASVRPKNASNYDSDLKAPQETKDFVLVNKKLFDEPMLGVMLEYSNKRYPTDNIDLYVYPIDSVVWDDASIVLESEIHYILAEVDMAVEHGYYQERGDYNISEFKVAKGEEELKGLKASFDLLSRGGNKYYSNAYIFIAKDKFIKFRTSFDSRETVKWDGDSAVNEILPLLEVPSESEYMRALRKQHEEKMANDVMSLIIQAANESSVEESAGPN